MCEVPQYLVIQPRQVEQSDHFMKLHENNSLIEVVVPGIGIF